MEKTAVAREGLAEARERLSGGHRVNGGGQGGLGSGSHGENSGDQEGLVSGQKRQGEWPQ
jgi:hypothetical protein